MLWVSPFLESLLQEMVHVWFFNGCEDYLALFCPLSSIPVSIVGVINISLGVVIISAILKSLFEYACLVVTNRVHILLDAVSSIQKM